jgi:hypothetical protein
MPCRGSGPHGAEVSHHPGELGYLEMAELDGWIEPSDLGQQFD